MEETPQKKNTIGTCHNFHKTSFKNNKTNRSHFRLWSDSHY